MQAAVLEDSGSRQQHLRQGRKCSGLFADVIGED
jgi:hypothetical protein